MHSGRAARTLVPTPDLYTAVPHAPKLAVKRPASYLSAGTPPSHRGLL